MVEVKVLVEGYSFEGTTEEKACPTIVLIKDNDLAIVIDPGSVKDQNIIIEKLKKEEIEIKDVDLVCISHSHLDHYRNIGMFPNAKSLDYWGLWDKDIVKDWESHITNNIQIIKTPGHSDEDITLLVKTKKGTYAIVGDLFWWFTSEEQKTDKESLIKHKDPYAKNLEKLKESRKLVLEKADFIIPGHGKMFEVEK